MRTLASIKRISGIHPIEGKDRIVLAQVDGWNVIVRKDEYKVGDLCVYVEIDSVMPERPEFEFLRPKKFRIKTMSMAGTISQGICFPLNILPARKGGYHENDDVTDILGVKQYEATMDVEPEQPKLVQKSKWPRFLMRWKWFRKLVLPKKQAKGFSSFISKTDETRVQNMPWILQDNGLWIATEKIDGCLTGDTYIKTSDGDIRIRDIVKNKMQVSVLSYNEELGQCEYKPVTDWHRIPAGRQLYKIGIGHRGKGNRPKFITATDNHKFLTSEGWKRADELSENDILRHYNKNYPLEMREVILGCLLGDSSFNSNGTVYKTVQFNHAETQLDYFLFKKHLFGKMFIEEPCTVSGYGSRMHRGKLVSNLMCKELADLCCVDGKKRVTQEWANRLTPASLAFWYMDDGTIQHRDTDALRCRISFATNGFSYDEVEILRHALIQKFNIQSKVFTGESYKGCVLKLDAENTEKFASLIAPYVCESMKYKLPLQYADMPCVYQDFSFDCYDGIVDTPILSIEKVDMDQFRERYVYDLEVADNHNYFAKNVLVHNCSGTFALVRHKARIPFVKDNFEYMVCSRNLRLWTPDKSSYWQVSEKYSVREFLEDIIGDHDWVAIQGECIGPGVQKNKYCRGGYELYVFNVVYPNGRLDSITARDVCEYGGMKFVPIVSEGMKLPRTVEEALKFAHGTSRLADVLREGIVFRSLDGKQSFKAVDPLFLIQYDE